MSADFNTYGLDNLADRIERADEQPMVISRGAPDAIRKLCALARWMQEFHPDLIDKFESKPRISKSKR